MGNLMTSMYTGMSGLRVNQTGLNVTAHNLANVNSIGYVRQQVLSTDFAYRNIGTTFNNTMQVGLGTAMTSVRQLRNSFLDQSYRFEVGRLGFYDAQCETVMEVEDIFGEMEGEAFQETLSGLWSAMQELAKEPGSIAKRATFVETSNSFIGRSELLFQQFKDYQVDQNRRIQTQVNRINEIGSAINQLNQDILKYESSGQSANDMRDTRNLLLDELSQMAKVSYRENLDGIISVNVEGMPFVTEDTSYTMQTQKISEDSEMIKVVWKGNGGGDVFDFEEGFSIEAKTDIGSLKGLLYSRGDFVARYTDIPVREKFDSDLDYEKAVELYNDKIDPSVIMTIEAQFDQLIHGLTTKINDILCPNEKISKYLENLELEADTSQKVTITLPDGTVKEVDLKDDKSGIRVWDKGVAPVGMDENATEREALFNRKGMDRYTQAEMSYVDVNGNTCKETVYIYNEEDPANIYSMFTLGEIEVNPKILNDKSILPLRGNKDGEADSYDVAVCDKLLNLWQEEFAVLNPNVTVKSKFKGYYDAMIVSNANKGKVMSNISMNQAEMVLEVETQRQGVSGVSSEEELVNLIKFQHAYNANSRYVNVIDEMLKHILERLG